MTSSDDSQSISPMMVEDISTTDHVKNITNLIEDEQLRKVFNTNDENEQDEGINDEEENDENDDDDEILTPTPQTNAININFTPLKTETYSVILNVFI